MFRGPDDKIEHLGRAESDDFSNSGILRVPGQFWTPLDITSEQAEP
jgi:hypothetical protein